MSRGSGWRVRILGAALVAVAVAGSIASDTARADSLPITFRGLLDVTLAGRGEAAEANQFTRDDSPFDGYGARLFADARPTDHLKIFTQLVLRDASGLYVEGAYALYTPSIERDLHLMAGKIPWPIGTWADRSYSNKNPLISTPLMYQYHTTLLWFDFPSSADALLAIAGQGQYGAGYGYAGPRGMPVIDDSYWDVGAVATGSVRPLEFAFGATAGTPGWGDTGIDENNGKTVLGRIGAVPAPFLRAGVSAAYGPYLSESLNPVLPAGKTGNDYHQTLLMSDLQLEVSRATLIAEAFTNTWQSPVVGDLDVMGGYVEGKVTVAAGFYAAARFDALRFGDITNSLGEAHTWDRDVDRFELGGGYRLERGTLVKAIWQRHTARARDGVPAKSDDIYGAQLSLSF